MPRNEIVRRSILFAIRDVCVLGFMWVVTCATIGSMGSVLALLKK